MGAALPALLASLAAASGAAGHRFYVSPRQARELGVEALAENVVGRVRDECDRAGPQGEGPPVADGADVIVMAPREALASIAARGFLNWHELGRTRGFHADRFAIEQELAMARLPYDAKGRRLLPKYALLDLKGEDLGHYALPTRYGDVAFVLKPEVSRRATWTWADSLDFQDEAGHFSRGGAANPVLAHTFAYRRKPQDENVCGNYCEAQVWGELALSDAAFAMVPKGTPAPKELSGLDVYEYEAPASSAALVAPGHAAQYVRGKRLSRASRPFKGSSTAASPPSSSPEETRALELYARSERPWDAFKPLLLAALRDKSPLVATEAVALASEHLDDPAVSAAVMAAKLEHEGDHSWAVEEWIERLGKPRFCERP